jgi:Mrp family chromosome partitioning ATPase
MPMMTQPMEQLPREALRAMQFPSDGMGTQVGGMSTVAGAPNLTMNLTVRPDQPLPTVTGQPPEIGLTQHSLPEETLDPRLVLVREPDSARAANFRVLRHHLLEAGRPQVVVVSSPRSGDGKTTTAINLALALAECGRAKVLLVEAHLRRPQLASIFRFVPPWCFAEQLEAHRHQPMLPWGMVDIPQLWLHVAAVNPRIEQRQLLDAPAFAIAMERLRLGGYDHIVIDAPPVIGSADVNLIQDAADGVLLALKARRTTARDLRSAIDQLTPVRVLGTVLLE